MVYGGSDLARIVWVQIEDRDPLVYGGSDLARIVWVQIEDRDPYVWCLIEFGLINRALLHRC